MYIIIWIVFGAVVGWLASILTNNNKRMGIIFNIVVGLLGSVIGGWIASEVSGYTVDMFSWQGFVFSIIGSVVLLVIANLFTRNRMI